MNTNRSNNRRRGRGNNRGQGGGNQGNRIDSRARGNAPQLLDKYKKLAHDASLNGDRVQTEYYLQFADHYFRVIADNKAQKDEQQRVRRDDREQDSDDSDDDFDQEDSGRHNRGRGRRNESRQESDGEFPQGVEGEPASEDENPFTRDAKPKRVRGRKKDEGSSEGIDVGVLPPSIRSEGSDNDDGEEKKPRRRTRRSRTVDGDDETLEAVG